PGLSAGAVTVQVYNQTGPGPSYQLSCRIPLTVPQSRPCPLCLPPLAPTPIDRAPPPGSFSIAGEGVSNARSGLRVPTVTPHGPAPARSTPCPTRTPACQ